MFLPLPTDAVTLTHAAPAPAPAGAAARPAAVPPRLAALAEELVESVPVRLTTTCDVPGAPAGPQARRPVLVARPRTSHDVARVIRAARAHGVAVAVPADERRAGTRDDDAPPGVDLPADTGTRALDGAVLVSTQGLTGVTILPVLARAHVGVGARWRDLLTAASQYGLVPLAALPRAADAERVTVASGREAPVTPDAPSLPVRVPDDARVTDVLNAHGVRAISVVTGTGALRRLAPTDQSVLTGSVTTGGPRGARGVVVAVELDLVERRTP